MKPNLADLAPQYIVDKTGKRMSIIIDLQKFEKFLEEVEERYFTLLAKKMLDQEDEYISHEEVRALSESKD